MWVKAQALTGHHCCSNCQAPRGKACKGRFNKGKPRWVTTTVVHKYRPFTYHPHRCPHPCWKCKHKSASSWQWQSQSQGHAYENNTQYLSMMMKGMAMGQEPRWATPALQLAHWFTMHSGKPPPLWQHNSITWVAHPIPSHWAKPGGFDHGNLQHPRPPMLTLRWWMVPLERVKERLG